MIYPDFLPAGGETLTEHTSLEILERIRQFPLETPLDRETVPTTYLQRGENGKTFLLLHGFDSSLFEYRRLLPLIARNHETWAIDLLGFGFTARPANIPISPVNIKTHLYAFWKTLIKKPLILVGASMGGAVALDFTLAHPEVVEKLILIDSAGLAAPPLAGKFLFKPLDSWATKFLADPRVRLNISRNAYHDRSLASPDACTCAALHLKCPNWSRALISFTKSGGYGGFAGKLAAIERETLIIWGENDRILGTKDAYRFQKALKHNRLVWIPECGHVPHLEKPRETGEAIESFITAKTC